MKILIDFNNIHDWQSFHEEFSKVMGFPDFYGQNMNAWIDCMTYIDAPDAGMSKITIQENESFEIQVLGDIDLQNEFFKGLKECTDFVNQRFEEAKSKTRISIQRALL